jgi:transcriptional regulator with XRE-family HTH domain
MPDELTHEVLAAKLRASRRAVELSQQQVSDRTAIPRTAMSDIERGVRRVDALELVALAEAYGQPVTHYLGDTLANPAGPGALAERLSRITSDLESYLERRAREIAEPLIRTADEAARELVAQAQREVQRQEDLVAELRRQWGAAERRAQRAEHQLGVVHRGGWCDTCDAARRAGSDNTRQPTAGSTSSYVPSVAESLAPADESPERTTG